MFPAALSEHLDALIDELIMDGGLEAASLASILLAARDSVNRDDLVTLSRKFWAANNDLLTERAREDAASPSPAFAPNSGPHAPTRGGGAAPPGKDGFTRGHLPDPRAR